MSVLVGDSTGNQQGVESSTTSNDSQLVAESLPSDHQDQVESERSVDDLIGELNETHETIVQLVRESYDKKDEKEKLGEEITMRTATHEKNVERINSMTEEDKEKTKLFREELRNTFVPFVYSLQEESQEQFVKLPSKDDCKKHRQHQRRVEKFKNELAEMIRGDRELEKNLDDEAVKYAEVSKELSAMNKQIKSKGDSYGKCVKQCVSKNKSTSTTPHAVSAYLLKQKECAVSANSNSYEPELSSQSGTDGATSSTQTPLRGLRASLLKIAPIRDAPTEQPGAGSTASGAALGEIGATVNGNPEQTKQIYTRSKKQQDLANKDLCKNAKTSEAPSAAQKRVLDLATEDSIIQGIGRPQQKMIRIKGFPDEDDSKKPSELNVIDHSSD